MANGNIMKTEESQSNNKGRVMTRRNFLTVGATTLVAPMVVSRCILGGPEYKAPSDKLRIAAVGLGMGSAYLNGCKSEEVVALCDLDHNRRAKVFEKYPDARRYHDYRIMFEKEANNIDAVIVATPDHTHTIILMAAIEMGKHIYCAKPVTHNIGEARRVKKALLKNKQLVTQSSVQSAKSDESCSTSELLRSGVIGPVRELHIWCDHPAYPCSLLRPEDKQTPPSGMDWDLWIGPAPYRPFNSAYHPLFWRPWWDFGSGTVGDMACHTFHVYFNELQLGMPESVYGEGSVRQDGWFKPVPTPECQSQANMITWEYPSRGDLPPMTLYWYDGGMKPHRPKELDQGLKLASSGLMFVGEEGKLITGYSGGNPYVKVGRKLKGGLLLPEDKFRDFRNPEETLKRTKDHYMNWVNACKSGSDTDCPIELGCEMTEVALLGSLALRTQRYIQWDSDAMRITNANEDINNMIDPEYRKGWRI